jgi:hypothetical protein
MHASVVGDSDHASGAAEKVQVGGLTGRLRLLRRASG